MHVDGFSVHTHRMFGVPPEELTFYCKWDFCAGDWLVDSSPMFMRGVAGGISNFGVGFLDLENALDVAFRLLLMQPTSLSSVPILHFD